MDEVQEVLHMTDMQAKRADLLARLDELDRMTAITTDRATLEKIAERKKAIRTALDKLLNA